AVDRYALHASDRDWAIGSPAAGVLEDDIRPALEIQLRCPRDVDGWAQHRVQDPTGEHDETRDGDQDPDDQDHRWGPEPSPFLASYRFFSRQDRKSTRL